MSFFTAVVAAHGRGWRARDVDVEDCEDLDELVARMRTAAHDDGPVLGVIEREDGWFALIRADDDDTPVVFVSDLAAARRGHYGPVLAAAEDVDAQAPVGVHQEPDSSDPDTLQEEPPDPDLDQDVTADGLDMSPGGALVQPQPVGTPVREWAGDPSVLVDFGVPADDLVTLVEENPDDPATVLAELGERAGFADQLEALR